VPSMSFNMSALRASIGTIPLRQPVRVAQRPTALSMPSYTGLSLSGRLSMSSEGDNLLRCPGHQILLAASAFPSLISDPLSDPPPTVGPDITGRALSVVFRMLLG